MRHEIENIIKIRIVVEVRQFVGVVRFFSLVCVGATVTSMGK